MTARDAVAGPRLCRLHGAAGRVEPCPEELCPFWEPGGAVLEGRCAFEHFDLTGDRELAGSLLQIRERLESARTGEEEAEARRLFHRLLKESSDVGGLRAETALAALLARHAE